MVKKLLTLLEDIYANAEGLRKILSILKKIWNKIVYVIILFYMVITSLQFEMIRKYISKKIGHNEIIDYMYNKSNWFYFALWTVLIFAFLYRVWKLGKIKISESEQLNKFIDRLHKEFIHDIRDNIKELDEKKQYSKENNSKMRQYIKDSMFQDISNRFQEYVDLLSEYLSTYSNSIISVCVKIVKFDNEDLANPCAITLARSSNTKNKRLKDDENVYIKQNSDFNYLYEGRNTFYAKSDLLKAHTEGNYIVSDSVDVWSKKYKSTIIVPIRYYSKHSRHNNIDMSLDIIGFLCIDSEDRMEHWEREDTFELNLLAIFADTFYTYLKKCKDIFRGGF